MPAEGRSPTPPALAHKALAGPWPNRLFTSRLRWFGAIQQTREVATETIWLTKQERFAVGSPARSLLASACGRWLALRPERGRRRQLPVPPLLRHQSPEEHPQARSGSAAGEQQSHRSPARPVPTAWPRQAPGETAVTPDAGRVAEVGGAAPDPMLGGRVAPARFTFPVSCHFGEMAGIPQARG